MKPIKANPNPTGLRIGVVTARFNAEVTSRLEQGALAQLKSMGLHDTQVTAVQVPGAFEIPLAARAFLDAGYDGVVALGAVIRGETSHFDYVCHAVERGCTELQVRYGRPVAFGVLTTDTDEQAMARANKGAEAAEVCLEMINLREIILRS